MKKTVFNSILAGSIIFNLLFFSIDIFPVIKQKIDKRLMVSSKDILDYDILETQIIDASLKMMASDGHYMPFEERSHFLDELKKFKKTESNPYPWFDHPKGILYTGMAAYAMNKNDSVLMRKIAQNFDEKVIERWDSIKDFVIVDQIPFGVTAIYLYQFFGDEKYKYLADELYQKVWELVSKESNSPLIFYRKDQDKKFYIVDTLGMVCPFLIQYGKIFHKDEALALAYEQLKYYTDNGLDCDSFLPSHAIVRPTDIKIGPHNWGRGVGWYFFPMSEYYKHIDKEEFKTQINGLMGSINLLGNEEGLWNQFLGGSDKFDASATVMYMYGFNNISPGTYTKEKILTLLKPHIYSGIIGPTSGGAFGINNYSRAFGTSELTQGIFLKLLSTVEE